MDDLRIRAPRSREETVISNTFIDTYMPRANGEFVKVYLCALRLLQDGDNAPATPSVIADILSFTEQDVIRALRYWEEEGLLVLDANVEPTNDAKDTTAMPRSITPQRMEELAAEEDVRELLFVAQQYFGTSLDASDTRRLLYFYDGLHFPTDLITYLLEYCVSGGHRNMRYIEKVAANWYDEGIRTLQDAKKATGSHNKDYFEILRSIGQGDRHPVESEIAFMKKWLDEFHFPMEIIREATDRTVSNTKTPNLKYTDKILSSWYKKGVTSLADIERIDAARSSEEDGKRNRTKSHNRWNNLEQRSYDFDAIEAQLAYKNS